MTSSAAKQLVSHSSAGNRVVNGPLSSSSASDKPGVAGIFQPGGLDQESCRDLVNSFDPFAAWGSKQVQFSHGGYGPWRAPQPFKLRGGGSPHPPPKGQQPLSLGAPSSSTSVQILRDSAERGTPSARLAALLMDIMEEEHTTSSSPFLTPGQQALYDLCKKDLDASRLDFETHWSRKLASASWSCSCFSKSRARSLENHESRENFTCRGPPPPPPPPRGFNSPLGRFRYVL